MSEEIQKTDNVNIHIDNELERLHEDLRCLVNYSITDNRRATKREALDSSQKERAKIIQERICILEDFLMKK